MSEPQGLVRPKGVGKLKTFIYLVGFGTRDLPACSTVPQPIRYCVPPLTLFKICDLQQILLNSVASVRDRTIAKERLPLVGEFSANFCGSKYY
jgi:hypothetical protein